MQEILTNGIIQEKEIEVTYGYLLERWKPQIFIDIGANNGTHSIFFLNNKVKTISFEPNPMCLPHFQRLCVVNGISGDMRLLAIGEEKGDVDLVYPPSRTFLGSVNPKVKAESGSETIKVRQEKLDGFFSEIKQSERVLIKIDTEGNELKVLLGAKKVLEKLKPIIIFEAWTDKWLQDARKELYEFFDNCGYEIKRLPFNGGNENISNEDFIRILDQNFIAIPSCKKF